MLVGTVEEEMNDEEAIIGDTEGDLSEEHWANIEQLREIIVEERTGNSIMLKEMDKKILKVLTGRVNEVIKYLKSKSITETNNLIRAANLGLAEWIELKKADYRKKNEPRSKRSQLWGI